MAGKRGKRPSVHIGFKKLKAKLTSQGAADPAALAYAIGAKKYGKAGMAAKAAAGRAKAAAKRRAR